ncbi:MAG: sensor histidine kinase [Eubacteriales bacterium]|nr:sensor histidine kinase [Eubacteriales bacterium]
MSDKRDRGGILPYFRSIRSAIFESVAVLVLCAVVTVTVVSIRYTNHAIYENSVLYTRTIIRQMNQNIDSYITYMDNIASLISGGGDAHEYLYQDSEKEACKSRLVQEFDLILKGRSDIKNIGIVTGGAEGEALFNTGIKKKNPNLDLSTQSWYTKAVGQYNESIITSSHVQHVIKGERPWVITLSRGIRSYTGRGESDGVVFIDLNYSAISELCDQNSIGSKGYVFIVDQDGNIVYHPQQQQLYNELQTENMAVAAETGSDTVVTGRGNDQKIYVLSPSEKTGWTVVGCMNMAELLKETRQARASYVVTAVVLVIVALLLSIVISGNITKPIQRLRDSMAKVQEGDFSAGDVAVISRNEIGSLTESFNMMTRRIQELMEQNVYEQTEKRKSELKALQSQINPHFLYNTLDSIIWMAEGKKNEEVVLMTASLARLLRQSITNEDEVVSIGNEVEYARSYLTIQKMRYKDKLEFQIDVDPAVLHVPIVKLVLQPIIENAIYHGLKYKDTIGLLQVRGGFVGNEVVLEVEDNGVGMDPEVLEHIFEKHKVNYRSNGVGVYNVQKRLKLYYGSEYGITYKSVKGQGTVAAITIPGRQEEKS